MIDSATVCNSQTRSICSYTRTLTHCLQRRHRQWRTQINILSMCSLLMMLTAVVVCKPSRMNSQHLRWSSRYFDEPSTAKKQSSPSRWNLKPRVSSAIFPASPPFFYARTSAECESPKLIRHAHSHGDFPTGAIPLCQVNQPRSESSNIISITVPVIASSVNEKAQTRKIAETKPNERLNEIIKYEESEYCAKDKRNSYLGALEDKDENALGLYNARSIYLKNSERSERPTQKKEKTPETEPLFFVEEIEKEKPRRYNRSSLKKQKVRLYDDRDYEPLKNVPTYECQDKKLDESEAEKSRRDQKTAEMRRKAFLRKISLQDTYVNYNQDYWLDFKNSGRFHKSIDLGYLGSEDSSCEKTETGKRTEKENWPEPLVHSVKSNQKQPLAITRQSKIPSNPRTEKSLRRTGSDPIILTIDKSSCDKLIDSSNQQNPSTNQNESSELLAEVIVNCSKQPQEKKKSWFFLASNENIPLFSERNGLIETDFDVLDEKSPENREVFRNGIDDPEGTEDSFYVPFDFSDFYEIKLTSESDGDSGKKSAVCRFQDGCSFFDETITSGDSDVFFETEPVDVSDEGRFFSSCLLCSVSSPPKSNSH